jgi:glycosyltransferase involved in cell wall biosynthesis
MSAKKKVVVLTHSPSPYQVELFDEVNSRGILELYVVYLRPLSGGRLWTDPKRAHASIVLSDKRRREDEAEILKRITEADVFVLNYYQHIFARHALSAAADAGVSLAFWGERPHMHALAAVSSFYRRYRLRQLITARGAIWGKGMLAISAYRKEFGDKCTYVNLPYFSNLARFSPTQTELSVRRRRRFLFSGALIQRKAVDLVAKAFKRLSEERDDVELQLIGAGEMEVELRILLAPLGDRVNICGFVDWRDLPTYYQNADVLCVPSRYDGWGLVVPEGLAAGLPVISSTQTGAALEFIRHRANGWLVEPNTELPILVAMREAASLKPDALKAMRQAAIDSVANHSLDQGATRFQSAVEGSIREQ